jgi:hypothetical protein
MVASSYNELLDDVAHTVAGLFKVRKAPLVQKKVKLPSGEIADVAEIDIEKVKKENTTYLQNLNKSIQAAIEIMGKSDKEIHKYRGQLASEVRNRMLTSPFLLSSSQQQADGTVIVKRTTRPGTKQKMVNLLRRIKRAADKRNIPFDFVVGEPEEIPIRQWDTIPMAASYHEDGSLYEMGVRVSLITNNILLTPEWKVLGKVEATSETNPRPIIQPMPDLSPDEVLALDSFRSQPYDPRRCDHCKVGQKRDTSVIIQNLKNKSLKQVGNNCLFEYTGIDPKMIQYITEFVARGTGGGGVYGVKEVALNYFMATYADYLLTHPPKIKPDEYYRRYAPWRSAWTQATDKIFTAIIHQDQDPRIDSNFSSQQYLKNRFVEANGKTYLTTSNLGAGGNPLKGSWNLSTGYIPSAEGRGYAEKVINYFRKLPQLPTQMWVGDETVLKNIKAVIESGLVMRKEGGRNSQSLPLAVSMFPYHYLFTDPPAKPKVANDYFPAKKNDAVTSSGYLVKRQFPPKRTRLGSYMHKWRGDDGYYFTSFDANPLPAEIWLTNFTVEGQDTYDKRQKRMKINIMSHLTQPSGSVKSHAYQIKSPTSGGMAGHYPANYHDTVKNVKASVAGLHNFTSSWDGDSKTIVSFVTDNGHNLKWFAGTYNTIPPTGSQVILQSFRIKKHGAYKGKNETNIDAVQWSYDPSTTPFLTGSSVVGKIYQAEGIKYMTESQEFMASQFRHKTSFTQEQKDFEDSFIKWKDLTPHASKQGDHEYYTMGIGQAFEGSDPNRWGAGKGETRPLLLSDQYAEIVDDVVKATKGNIADEDNADKRQRENAINRMYWAFQGRWYNHLPTHIPTQEQMFAQLIAAKQFIKDNPQVKTITYDNVPSRRGYYSSDRSGRKDWRAYSTLIPSPAVILGERMDRGNPRTMRVRSQHEATRESGSWLSSSHDERLNITKPKPKYYATRYMGARAIPPISDWPTQDQMDKWYIALKIALQGTTDVEMEGKWHSFVAWMKANSSQSHPLGLRQDSRYGRYAQYHWMPLTGDIAAQLLWGKDYEGYDDLVKLIQKNLKARIEADKDALKTFEGA